MQLRANEIAAGNPQGQRVNIQEVASIAMLGLLGGCMLIMVLVCLFAFDVVMQPPLFHLYLIGVLCDDTIIGLSHFGPIVFYLFESCCSCRVFSRAKITQDLTGTVAFACVKRKEEAVF